jgi:hypothetical protein
MLAIITLFKSFQHEKQKTEKKKLRNFYHQSLQQNRKFLPPQNKVRSTQR